MIKHITYTNDKMTVSAEVCKSSALKYGASESKAYRREDMGHYLDLPAFNMSHFCDYWMWKPIVCLHAINSMNDGEILCYSDAGIRFVGGLEWIVDEMTDDIFLFSNGWKHSEWCKGDVFKAIGVVPGEEKQVQASLMFFRASEKSRKFITEWFAFCSMGNLITDARSTEPNVPTFADTRHDQSIISTLAIRDGIPLNWYPVLTAMHIKEGYNNKYPAIADHHRKRNNEWMS